MLPDPSQNPQNSPDEGKPSGSAFDRVHQERFVPEGYWREIDLVVHMARDLLQDLRRHGWLDDIIKDVIEDNKGRARDFLEGTAGDVIHTTDIPEDPKTPSWESRVDVYYGEGTETPLISVFLTMTGGT